jgi:putative (di)nucleoside polyphosphate hydrolase
MAFTHTETYSAEPPIGSVVSFNAQGLGWAPLPEVGATAASHIQGQWQLPQGGIEPREPSREAAFRELWEETGVRNASLLAEIPGWLTCELPPELLGVALKGKYSGQRLRWYAMRFEGNDDEIDIGGKGAMKSEFDAWRWAPLKDVPGLAVDFRRSVYEEVVQEFARYGRRRSAAHGATQTLQL